MFRNFWYILVGVIFIASCDTEIPAEVTSEAVFYVRGTINGQKISLNAGDDGYYMLPYFKDDTLGIRTFSGKLGIFDCIADVNCPQSVEVIFREKEIENGVRESIEKSVFARECEVRGPASYLFQSYKATFISKSFPDNLTHSWNFGDGNSSTDENPVHYYLNVEDSIITPSLEVLDGVTSCSNWVAYELNFVSPCEVDFNPEFGGGQFFFYPEPTIGRTQRYSYNGDLYEDYFTKGPPSDSITLVCLESTETATNCISYKCKNVVLDTATVGCVANFDTVKEKVTLKDVRDYLEITIKWQNSVGKVYQSDLFSQPNGFGFEIVEVLDYKDYQENEGTKMVVIKFNLRLFGSSETDYLDFESEKSVVAIAFPKI